jgi:catechol 2,3-dioxygenase-like lactoylglutathione lyase family enzyme
MKNQEISDPIKFICPHITVSNIEVSKRFYTEIIGQKVKYDFGKNFTCKSDQKYKTRVYYT